MSVARSSRFASLIVLAVGLIAVVVIWGIPAKYPGAQHFAIVTIPLAVICGAAWLLGANAVTSTSPQARQLAAAGTLFVLPFALFSFLAGVGPPAIGQNEAEALRWLVLIIDSLLVGAGWVVFRGVLREAGEHFYSTLGFAAAILAAPLYVLYPAIQLAETRDMLRTGVQRMPAEFKSVDDVAFILLFFGGILTYLATAAFAASASRVQWLGRRSACVIVVLSFVAAIALVHLTCRLSSDHRLLGDGRFRDWL